MIKNLPCIAGDIGLIPGRGSRIPHAVDQLSPDSATTKAKHHKQRVLRPDAAKYTHVKKREAAEKLLHVCARVDRQVRVLQGMRARLPTVGERSYRQVKGEGRVVNLGCWRDLQAFIRTYA